MLLYQQLDLFAVVFVFFAFVFVLFGSFYRREPRAHTVPFAPIWNLRYAEFHMDVKFEISDVFV